jgi:hypothetical protein
MLIEFALHVLPPLRSSIEVDANLMREHQVDYSGGWVCHGFDRVVGFYNGCVGTTSSLGPLHALVTRGLLTVYIPSVLALRIIS